MPSRRNLQCWFAVHKVEVPGPQGFFGRGQGTGEGGVLASQQLQATPCYLRYKVADFTSPLEGPVLLRCTGNVFIVPKHRVWLSTHFTSLGVEPLGKLVMCRVRQITHQENTIKNAISCVCTHVCVCACVCLYVCVCMCLCVCRLEVNFG